MYFKLIFILFSMSFSQMDCVMQLTPFTILGRATQTTEVLYGVFSCNGGQLQEICRNDTFPTRTPCTGMSYLTGNDSYEMTYGGRKETLNLYNPQIFSSYINGFQLFTEFGPITTGTCQGGFFYTVQMLYPKNYQGCLSSTGLLRAESFYAYVRIQGGRCQSDCQGYININFSPPVAANQV